MLAKRFRGSLLLTLCVIAPLLLVAWSKLVDNFLGVPLTPAVPTDGQLWKYSSAAGAYQLSADNTLSGSAAGGDLSGAYPNPTVVDLSLASEARGDLAARGAATWARLPIGGNATVLGSDGTDPLYLTLGGQVAPTRSGSTLQLNLSIASQAQGDILYYNGVGWVRLAPGTSGQTLHTNGAGANPTWDADDSTAFTGDLETTANKKLSNSGATQSGAVAVADDQGLHIGNAAGTQGGTVSAIDTNKIRIDAITDLNAKGLTNVAASEAADDLMLRGASVWGRLAKGAASTVLRVDSGGTLAYGGVTSAMITDGEIVSADISGSAAIPYSKLAFSNNIVAGDIATDAVTTAEILDDTIALVDLGDGIFTANAAGRAPFALGFIDNTLMATNNTTTGNVVNGTLKSEDFTTTNADALLSTQIKDGEIVNADISATAAIVYSKLAFSNNIVAGDLAANSVDASEIVGGAPGAAGAELANTITNITAATNLTIDPTGDYLALAASVGLRLAGQAGDVTSFAAGDFGYDTTKKSYRLFPGVAKGQAVVKVLASTTDSTISNTSSETQIGDTLSCAANSLTVGKTIDIYISGQFSAVNTTDTFILRVRYGGVAGTILAQSVAASPTAQATTDLPWRAHIVITVRTTGNPGATVASGFLEFQSNSDAKVLVRRLVTITGAPDLTVAGDLVVTGQWSAASASNSITSWNHVCRVD